MTAETTNQPLAFVVERVGQHTGFCPGCEQHVPVMFSDELYAHATPAAHPCMGDKYSRCESRKNGFRCQLPPHETGKHRWQPSATSGLASWDDEPERPRHPHGNGGACWTHKNCEAREALARLQAWAADKNDAELHDLIARVAAAIPEPFN